MKLEITREWFERKVKLEGDLEIGAGLLAVDPVQDQNAAGTPRTTSIGASAMDDFEPPHELTTGDAIAYLVVGAIMGIAMSAGAFIFLGY